MKLLIVDDEADLLSLLKYVLSPYYEQIFLANNGKKAIEVHSIENVDLIISDISMPEMDGLELLQTLRMNKNLVPFIIMTGYGDMDMVIKDLRLGAFDFINKPFEVEIIIKRVTEALNLKKCMNVAELEANKEFENNINNGLVENKVDFLSILKNIHLMKILKNNIK